MARKLVTAVLCVWGVLLLVGGNYLIAHYNDLRIHDDSDQLTSTLPCVLENIFPCGVSVGIAALLLGALVIAIAIGVPPSSARQSAPAGAMAVDRSWRQGWRGRLLLFAIVLALLSAGCSRFAAVQSLAVAAWFATFVAAATAMILADRTRGSGFGNPFAQRYEALGLVLIVVLELIWVGHDVTHWRWGGIPDEAHFFQVARSIARGESERLLFSEQGVFEYHPVLSSYYQALFMKVFGTTVFAWRFSSAVALAVSLPFVYLLTRELYSRRAALAATLFFGSAQLPAGFAHFGYNNVQAYPVVIGALGLLVWAAVRRSLLGYYLAGCAAGLGFYTYQPAILTAPLLILLGLSLRALPWRGGDRALTVALTLGVVFTALPAWMHLPETISHMVQQTSVTGGLPLPILEMSSPVRRFLSSGANQRRLLEHWLQSVVYPFWFKEPHHFESNPIVDPIAGACAAVGLWLSVRGVWRQANARFLLLAYIGCALLVGATSPHERPPLTRLLFLSPFLAMLGAVALDQALDALGGSTARRRLAAAFAGSSLLIAAVIWSVLTVHHNIYQRFYGYGDGTTSELIRMAQSLPPSFRIVLVQQEPTGQPAVDMVLDEYGMQDRFTYLHGVGDEELQALAAMEPPVAVFHDLKILKQLAAVERLLSQRFPSIRWRSSEAGRSWNLRYFYVPAE